MTTPAAVPGLFWRPSAALRVAPDPSRHRRLAVTIVAATLASLLILLTIGNTPTATGMVLGTRVAAITPETGPAVGAQTGIAPGHVGSNTRLFDDSTTGCCVAPRTAAMGESFLANGSTVRYSSTATAFGDDANTLQNLARSRGANGHDVIVHGGNFGEETRFIVDGQPVNTHQIADAIRANPDYRGGPINLVTCGGGCGPADELAEILGVRVTSSPHPVDLDPWTGLLREFP